MKTPKTGKRYWWYTNNADLNVKNGLFTGERMGDVVILVCKDGATWSIPIQDLMDNHLNYVFTEEQEKQAQ